MSALFNLLPAVYRLRDAAKGDPLRALVEVIEREVERVEGDISTLYDNWFIETCDEWVVPYIGDLLGVRNFLPVGDAAFSQRSYVANTLAYRRRKGTAAVLEQLGRDITGWPCKAIEFFERLTMTQHINHVRSHSHATTDIRSAYAMQSVGTPFEAATHTVEVRHIDNARGRYNIPHLGLFLWRLQSYLLKDARASQVDEKRYTFNPLGGDLALFNVPQTEDEITQVTAAVNVPAPLSRLTLHHDIEDYYGSPDEIRSLLIKDAGVVQTVDKVVVCNLSDKGVGQWHTKHRRARSRLTLNLGGSLSPPHRRARLRSVSRTDSEAISVAVHMNDAALSLTHLRQASPGKWGYAGSTCGSNADRRDTDCRGEGVE